MKLLFLEVLVLCQLCAPLALDAADAVAAQSRLATMQGFVEDWGQIHFDSEISECKNQSAVFNESCSTVEDKDCKLWRCSDSSFSTEQNCTDAGASWDEDGDAPDSTCCEGGNKRCSGCCDVCWWMDVTPKIFTDNDENLAMYNQRCNSATFQNLALCGTLQGQCHYCDGRLGKDSQESCEESSAGSCSDPDRQSESDCENNGGTWTLSAWTLNTSVTSQASCESVNYCALCSGTQWDPPDNPFDCSMQGSCSFDGFPMLQSSCKSSGYTWTPATWQRVDASNEDSCSNTWYKVQTYSEGDKLPAAPMANGTACVTGPTHWEPSHILSTECLGAAQFLADATSKTASSAWEANPTYYSKVSGSVLWRPIVTNADTAEERAEMTLTQQTCLVLIVSPMNRGKFVLDGSENTTAIILKPTNYEDADSLKIQGGSTIILGGNNAGAIDLDSSGKFEVYSLTNTGPITAKTSLEILLVNIINEASVSVSDAGASCVNITNSGSISIVSSSAALYDVINSGTVTATDTSGTVVNVMNSGTVIMNGGSMVAKEIRNTGLIRINSGEIDLELLCPDGDPGSVVLADGVTGVVSYIQGCEGQLTVPEGVTRNVTTTSTSGNEYLDGAANAAKLSASFSACMALGLLLALSMLSL